jgi:hypothetical protein
MKALVPSAQPDARDWAKAVVAGIRWPARNGLAPGDSASARSCLPRPADQQAPELGGSVAASFREMRARTSRQRDAGDRGGAFQR